MFTVKFWNTMVSILSLNAYQNKIRFYTILKDETKLLQCLETTVYKYDF